MRCRHGRGLVALFVGSACALSAQDSASTPRRAVVTGQVVGEGGKPIEAADVVTRALTRAAGDSRKATPTSCTIVVWERE